MEHNNAHIFTYNTHVCPSIQQAVCRALSFAFHNDMRCAADIIVLSFQSWKLNLKFKSFSKVAQPVNPSLFHM